MSGSFSAPWCELLLLSPFSCYRTPDNSKRRWAGEVARGKKAGIFQVPDCIGFWEGGRNVLPTDSKKQEIEKKGKRRAVLSQLST